MWWVQSRVQGRGGWVGWRWRGSGGAGMRGSTDKEIAVWQSAYAEGFRIQCIASEPLEFAPCVQKRGAQAGMAGGVAGGVAGGSIAPASALEAGMAGGDGRRRHGGWWGLG